jgi:hypothetical protein
MSLVGVGFLRNSLLEATGHKAAPKTTAEKCNPFYSYGQTYHDRLKDKPKDKSGGSSGGKYSP